MEQAADARIAEAFANVARQLQGQGSPKKVLARVTCAGVEMVGGCDHAAVSIVRRNGRIETVAPTDGVPPAVDAVQHEVGQGPCLDAIAEHDTYLIDDLATDARWPSFSRRAFDATGVRSMLSFQLFVEEDTIGALSLYSRSAAAFDADDRALGTILATHAALAVRAAQDRERAANLDVALVSSRDIGVAMGVLMSAGLVSRDEAFTLLRRASQHLNRKLRDVALEVADTGEIPHRRT
ncbi:GAF and ANTAR domain-containing protein [Pseudonocardia sp. TRM90224]|uniref:GAF and ANTAR domain-containing protein n=1 Tax=Pseudonocardia sp. TRM90224 TaxID=2812678 RepID=UPI002105C73C|nr:GAF and ANTAR domain-containing protein [Pseudonocardia sp. TRM90224]